MAQFPKRAQVFDNDFQEREVEVLDRNGSLIYIERDDGTTDWVNNDQIDREWDDV